MMYSHRRGLEARNIGLRKKSDCTIYVAKTKVLISCMVNASDLCLYFLAYAKHRFSNDVAHLIWK